MDLARCIGSVGSGREKKILHSVESLMVKAVIAVR